MLYFLADDDGLEASGECLIDMMAKLLAQSYCTVSHLSAYPPRFFEMLTKGRLRCHLSCSVLSEASTVGKNRQLGNRL